MFKKSLMITAVAGLAAFAACSSGQSDMENGALTDTLTTPAQPAPSMTDTAMPPMGADTDTMTMPIDTTM